MTPSKAQFVGTLVTALVFVAGFVTMLVLYLLKPCENQPPPCNIVVTKGVAPPNVPIENAGPYSIETAKFAMVLVAEITQAYQKHRAPRAYPGTKILKVLSGIDSPDATDDPYTHRLQQIGYIVQVLKSNQIWICFRGSQTQPETTDVDEKIAMVEWNRQVLPGALVGSGAYKAYLELQGQIITTLQQYATPTTTVYISGISLGSVLAMLTMADLVLLQPQLQLKDIRIYTFAPPRVGNQVFVDALRAQRLLSNPPLREAFYIANESDKIPNLPPTTEVTPYAQFPLTTFKADWGSAGANHELPVHAAHIDRVVNVQCHDPKQT